MPVNVERDHVRGNSDAPLTLLEYGDYECSSCGRAYPIVNRLREHFGERLRFVFRHFPQSNVHPRASVAAQAAEAASAQGRFWEMHDMLYEHQQELADADLSQYALRIGLEIYKFQAEVGSEHFSRRVVADYESGVASGVKGTPTFFIQNERYTSEREFNAIKKALEKASSEG